MLWRAGTAMKVYYNLAQFHICAQLNIGQAQIFVAEDVKLGVFEKVAQRFCNWLSDGLLRLTRPIPNHNLTQYVAYVAWNWLLLRSYVTHLQGYPR